MNRIEASPLGCVPCTQSAFFQEHVCSPTASSCCSFLNMLELECWRLFSCVLGVLWVLPAVSELAGASTRHRHHRSLGSQKVLCVPSTTLGWSQWSAHAQGD